MKIELNTTYRELLWWLAEMPQQRLQEALGLK